MPASNPTPINELLWTATRYSDVLKLDRRVVAQALEKAPSTQHNGERVWHVRDAMPAIFKPDARKNDPNNMEPKEALDYYRAQRERIKLAEDIRKMIPAADIEQAIGAAFKALVQTLDALPDALERDCGLPPVAVTAAQHAVDTMRDTLYANLMNALSADG
jgi:hypothetical protein